MDKPEGCCAKWNTIIKHFFCDVFLTFEVANTKNKRWKLIELIFTGHEILVMEMNNF